MSMVYSFSYLVFRSSLNLYQQCFGVFSIRSYTHLLFILKYFIFWCYCKWHYYQTSTFQFFNASNQIRIRRTKINFCILTVYPVTLLDRLNSSRSFKVTDSLGFSTNMLPVNKDCSIYFSPVYMTFMYFPTLLPQLGVPGYC